MEYLLAIGTGFGFVIWDMFQNGVQWTGYAIAELHRAIATFKL